MCLQVLDSMMTVYCSTMCMPDGLNRCWHSPSHDRSHSGAVSDERLCMQTCVGQDPPGEWADTPTGKGKRYLHREDTLKSLLEQGGFSKASISRDTDLGVLERQGEISTFGTNKLILIFAATK